MKVINLPAADATKLSPAGNRDFLHIQNNSGQNIFICFDSDDTTAAATLNETTGFIVADQGVFQLNNDGNRNMFNKPVWAFSLVGGEVRIQGES